MISIVFISSTGQASCDTAKDFKLIDELYNIIIYPVKGILEPKNVTPIKWVLTISRPNKSIARIQNTTTSKYLLVRVPSYLW